MKQENINIIMLQSEYNCFNKKCSCNQTYFNGNSNLLYANTVKNHLEICEIYIWSQLYAILIL